MKKIIVLSIFAFTILFSCQQPTSQSQANKQVLRHVVLFDWVDDITTEKEQELVAHFVSLKDKIDVIQDFEYGTDISVEGLDKGYNHCFIVTFKDEAGRDTYLPHPDHKAFGEAVTPFIKNVLVVDYLSHKE